jgi:hypothetical protein
MHNGRSRPERLRDLLTGWDGWLSHLCIYVYIYIYIISVHIYIYIHDSIYVYINWYISIDGKLNQRGDFDHKIYRCALKKDMWRWWQGFQSLRLGHSVPFNWEYFSWHQDLTCHICHQDLTVVVRPTKCSDLFLFVRNHFGELTSSNWNSSVPN